MAVMDEFPPFLAMVLIDCAMLAAAIVLFVMCFGQRARIRDAGGGPGIVLLLCGFLTITAFHAYDLNVMTLGAWISGEQAAMAEMVRLHLNYSWYLHVIGITLIVSGIWVCVRAFGSQLRRIELARVEAEDADRAKTAFLAAMSHELRTPLNAILGFSEFMTMDKVAQQPDRCREYAGNIHASGQHLRSLVDDLLDLARIEEGRLNLRFEPLELAPIIDEAVRMVAADADRGDIALSSRVAQALPPLRADRRSVRQIIINLMSNAVRHTPPGGHIRIEAEQDGSDITLAVMDDGEGIAADLMDQLFDPYATGNPLTDTERPGHGLGLAISQRLVRAHGGFIRVESTVGGGTTATVVFPKAVQADTQVAA